MQSSHLSRLDLTKRLQKWSHADLLDFKLSFQEIVDALGFVRGLGRNVIAYVQSIAREHARALLLGDGVDLEHPLWLPRQHATSFRFIITVGLMLT